MKNLDKSLYKLEIFTIKTIPIVLALICFLNTLLCYLGIDLLILTYIGGVSFLTIGFLYLSSYVFKFCSYHRMFLHYVSITWLMNIYDYYIGIPVSDKELFMISMIITGIFIFLVLYSYMKSRKE